MTVLPTRPRIITIDGEPGAGKTTACTLVAQRLGYQTLTTGMFYCAVGSVLRGDQILPEDIATLSIAKSLEFDISNPSKPEISFGGVDLTERVFSQDSKNRATSISSTPQLVTAITSLIRATSASGEWIMDRGSEVFPDADLKIWLKASPQARAARRCGQLALRGDYRPYPQVLSEILERETRDRLNPYINLHDPAELVIDNTNLDEEQTFRVISNLISMSPAI